MSLIRKCPFCDNMPEIIQDNKIILKCPVCEKNNIFLKIVADNIEEAIKLWNTRVFDKKLLNERDDIINWINQYYDDITPTTKEEIINQMDYTPYDDIDKTYGCLIFKDGKIADCDFFAHFDMLFRYLKVDSSNYRTFDEERLCFKHNIIKVTVLNKNISILVNKPSKTQLNSLFKYISNPMFNNTIKSFSFWKYEDFLISFNNLNDCLNYIDKGNFNDKIYG